MGWAVVIAVVAVAIVAAVDILAAGGIESGVLALLVATITPLVPAFIARITQGRK